MLQTVCQLLAIPLAAAMIGSLWTAISIERRNFRAPGPPRGAGRRFSNLALKAEELGRRRWSDGNPRSALVGQLAVARAINGVSTVIVCLGLVWGHVRSPMGFMGALMATAAIYLLFTAMGSLLSYLIMLAMGWARIGGEGGGGSKVSLYIPDPGPGGDALPIPWSADSSRHTGTRR